MRVGTWLNASCVTLRSWPSISAEQYPSIPCCHLQFINRYYLYSLRVSMMLAFSCSQDRHTWTLMTINGASDIKLLISRCSSLSCRSSWHQRNVGGIPVCGFLQEKSACCMHEGALLMRCLALIAIMGTSPLFPQYTKCASKGRSLGHLQGRQKPKPRAIGSAIWGHVSNTIQPHLTLWISNIRTTDTLNIIYLTLPLICSAETTPVCPYFQRPLPRRAMFSDWHPPP